MILGIEHFKNECSEFKDAAETLADTSETNENQQLLASQMEHIALELTDNNELENGKLKQNSEERIESEHDKLAVNELEQKELEGNELELNRLEQNELEQKNSKQNELEQKEVEQSALEQMDTGRNELEQNEKNLEQNDLELQELEQSKPKQIKLEYNVTAQESMPSKESYLPRMLQQYEIHVLHHL